MCLFIACTLLASIGVTLLKCYVIDSIHYNYLSIDMLRDQWNLFKAIWMGTPQMFPSIPDLARVFPWQQKIAITNEANK